MDNVYGSTSCKKLFVVSSNQGKDRPWKIKQINHHHYNYYYYYYYYQNQLMASNSFSIFVTFYLSKKNFKNFKV